MVLHSALLWLARQNAVDAAASWTSVPLEADADTDMPVRMILSNVAGSLSILCWFIVFTPQLWVNYKRQSGESLSLPFLYIWLAGDFFNVAGATLDNLLLTMRILAWYYTIADVYYYRNKARRLSEPSKIDTDGTLVEPGNRFPEHFHTSTGSAPSDHTRRVDDIEELDADETSTLLSNSYPQGSSSKASISTYSAISSVPSITEGSDLLRHRHLHSIQETDSTHSSIPSSRTLSSAIPSETATDVNSGLQRRRRLRQLFLIVLPIFAIAFFVWSLIEWHDCVKVPTQDAEKKHDHRNHGDHDRENEGGLTTALLLGWSSAALYLGSRVPQIYKNWRLRSCEGLSLLMFVFSLLGNSLFIASIFLSSTERSYLIRNMPWWLGSAGTLLFDLTIFIQFFLYKEQVPERG
ncbi:hypothetical protein EC968_004431 [Mortierella alpina]|nr:hypothetical protein EC968_004431 [Mortierella alpina]